MKQFKKVLLVATAIIGVIGAIFALALAQMGVLAEARSLGKWEAEAHYFGFPTSSKQLLAKYPYTQQDGVVIAGEIVAKFEKESATHKLYAPPPKAPNPSYAWPNGAKEGWLVLQPQLARIHELETAKQWFGKYKDDKVTYQGRDVLRQRDSIWLGAIAGHLANSGEIENACRVWHLRSLLNRAHGERPWVSAHISSLRQAHAELVEIGTYLPIWKADQRYQQCVRQCFEAAEANFDYRKAAWSDALVFQEGLNEYSEPLSSLRNDFSRSLFIASKDPFLSATKATNLRAFMTGYDAIDRNPYSGEAYNDYITGVKKSHASANQFSARVFGEVGPFPRPYDMIRPQKGKILFLRAKFPWLK